MKRVLALDLSKHGTGWAVGCGGAFPLARTVSFKSAHRGGVFAQYMAWLRDHLLTSPVDVVAYEAPLLTTKVQGSSEKLMLLIGLAAMTEAVCSMFAVPVKPVAASTWRVAFLGEGFPKDPKGDAVRMCGSLGWQVSNDDEADACGVWCWAHLNHGDVDAMRGQLSRAKVREMEV